MKKQHKTYYIGLGVTYHDPSLAIVDQSGQPLFAEASERFLQKKRAINCLSDDLNYLPRIFKTFCADADAFVIACNWKKNRPLYENGMLLLGRLSGQGLLKSQLRQLCSPIATHHLHHMMTCNRRSIFAGGTDLVRFLIEQYPNAELRFADFDHHLCHAASAAYAGAFENAACAVVDSYGENGSAAFYRYNQGRLQRLHESRGLGSLGLYFMKMTELCGFNWMNGEEWKVMGLAAYGELDEALYSALQKTLIVKGLDMMHPSPGFFDIWRKIQAKQRKTDEPTEAAADIAYTAQYFFSDIMTQLLTTLQQRTQCNNLLFAGGCALNSSFNGQIGALTAFENVYIPPAPADDGTALGAAWLAQQADGRAESSVLNAHPLNPFLGSAIDGESLQRLVKYSGLQVHHLPNDLCETTARLLAKGKLVAWMQGRAEFGPRALGNRSILADARDPTVKDKLNWHVKFREEYRPFAPSILDDYGKDYFQGYRASPYMAFALKFRPEVISLVPGVVHRDLSGRVQSVDASWNPRFHQLLECFRQITGIPLLLNTSFNIMGKPMVHSVEDAVAVFMSSGLDALVIDSYLFSKSQLL